MAVSGTSDAEVCTLILDPSLELALRLIQDSTFFIFYLGCYKESVRFHVDRPWGGNGGSEWNDGTFSGITKIVIRSGDAVDSIQIEYVLTGEGGNINVWGDKHGGDGGEESTIQFNFPQETLTKIEGYYGSYARRRSFFEFLFFRPVPPPVHLVKCLTFHTNRRKYGPYGKGGSGGDRHFESQSNGKIVGFLGRAGDYLNAIGVYTLTVSERDAT